MRPDRRDIKPEEWDAAQPHADAAHLPVHIWLDTFWGSWWLLGYRVRTLGREIAKLFRRARP